VADLLIAEQLFLLAHDEASGRNRSQTFLEYGLAGALLIDLALAERVAMKDGRLVVAGERPDHQLLAAAFDRIATDKPRRVRHCVTALARGLKLGRRVGASLVERGVLLERRRRVWGLFPHTTWPERDPGPERRLRAEIVAVLLGGAPPDARIGPLIGLLEALGVTRRLVTADLDRAARKQARGRAKAIVRELKEGTGIAAAVQASVREVQAAVIAATVTATAASTTVVAPS
jgi:golgi phosphoprotein 3